jgi:hypothetical protein
MVLSFILTTEKTEQDFKLHILVVWSGHLRPPFSSSLTTALKVSQVSMRKLDMYFEHTLTFDKTEQDFKMPFLAEW